jgi:hypothetical protein
LKYLSIEADLREVYADLTELAPEIVRSRCSAEKNENKKME